MRRITALWPLAAFALAGCSGLQSSLDPRGPAAGLIAEMSWILFAGGAAIFLLVVAILAYVLVSDPARRRPISGTGFIIAGGVALPVVTLSLLLVYTFDVGGKLGRLAGEDPLVIEVTGHQWWWEFRYDAGEPHRQVWTANELHIPVGRPVELRLTSADVIHTLWVPNLAGKRDLIPGQTNTLVLQADRPGLFGGQCNEFCGAQHALMRLYVIAEPQRAFEAWLARQRQPALSPVEPLHRVGEAAFLGSGCPVCHTIRGTEAMGRNGPDLTHFGSRRTLAGGILPNTLGNRQAWIVDAQHIKPENRMPSFNEFDGETLRALAAYLGTLE